jgi:hypothetical protein
MRRKNPAWIAKVRFMRVDLICLDADDTLWHNIRHFDVAERALFTILNRFADADILRASGSSRSELAISCSMDTE